MKGIGVGVWSFGMGTDRYVGNGYKPYMKVEERVAQIAKLPNVTGLEVTFPNEVDTKSTKQFKALLDQHGLKLCGMGVEIVCDGQWKTGSFTSPDPQRREKTISMVREAMDVAAEFGVSTVSLWLGQDGFDYVFEEDYEFAWNSLVEGLRTVANHRPDIQLGLEYKTSEPKMANYVNSGGKALALAYATGKKNVGITLDVGHALNARENPAEIAAVLLAEKRLFHLHLNDNYAWADDDMPVGSVHLIQFLELFYWLKKMNYDGWLSLDLYPYRDNPTEACRTSLHFIEKLQNLVDQPGFDKVVESNRYAGSRSVRAMYELLMGK
ncbi:MAG: sugar phosphate isomerase/epimerase family protein [Anaerolineaceae bacterium]|jgi:xylose isomerase